MAIGTLDRPEQPRRHRLRQAMLAGVCFVAAVEPSVLLGGKPTSLGAMTKLVQEASTQEVPSGNSPSIESPNIAPPEASAASEPSEPSANVREQANTESASSGPASVTSGDQDPRSSAVSRPPVPIPPNANELAWQREILTVSLLGVMGVGCTIAALLAVWILSKNMRPRDAD